MVFRFSGKYRRSDHWNDFRCSYRYRDIRQGTLETVTQGIAYKEEQTYDKKHIGTSTGF